MSAVETAKNAVGKGDERPSSAEVTGWLLEGRWFTIDPAGKITAWSPAAAERFGWQRGDITGESFAETLLAEPKHGASVVESLMNGGATDGACFTGELDAVDSDGGALRAAFALVPIQLSVGYEFNSLLQEISTGSGNDTSLAALRSRHESVLGLIESALSGKAAESAQTEEGGRLAGALVVFRAADAPPPGGMPDNVVSIADAAGLEEARSQLERARAELEEARVELRSLEGQLDEARREAQRSRNEADVARQEANDARDALALSQRETEEGKRNIDDQRRAADSARTAAEEARIRTEEAQREADRLRAELNEARSATRRSVEEADAELSHARAEAEWARSEAAEHKAEAARHEAEVESLRARLQESQRELGTLRAELEAARAEHAQGAAVAERRADEAERLRTELEEALSEVEQLREAAEAAAAQPPVGDERLQAVFDAAPVPTAIVATDGRFVDVNAALCQALGHERERLLSDGAPPVVHPDDVDGKRALVARMLAGEQASASGLRRYLHADGHAVTVRERVTLVRDPDGRPRMFVLQLEDAESFEENDEPVVDAELAGEELVPAGRGELTAEALRRALEDEMFELHAQPVLDLRTNEVTQYELLIRMVGEGGRLVLPQAFLEPARRAGLAHAIDRWVVREAIAMLSHIPDPIRLEVNLSPEAIHDADLPALIDQELASTPVDPGRLVLEITGGTAADDLDAARTLAKRIRSLGCRFALDDFRSTFGSFRLLKDLPLDYLKLDGELVGSLAESRTSQLIVKALVDVAAGTGAKTVAVFVSDEQTLGMLRQQGVDFAQGYTVGRPRPVAEVWPGEEEPAQLPAGS